MTEKKSRNVLMALGAAALFGAATPLSKPLLETFSPLQLAGLLYLGGALGVLPAMVLAKKESSLFALRGKNLGRLFGAILFGGILGPVLLLIGLKLASAASVSLWLQLELAATGLLGILFFKDHLGKKGAIGVALAILAGILLVYQDNLAGWQAGGLVALACICWGLDNHFTALIDGLSPSQSTFCKGLVAGIFNLSLGAWIYPLTLEVEPLAFALGLGALAYGVSIALYISSAQGLGATRSQLLFSSSPLFALLIAYFWLGETLMWFHGAALLLFFAAVGAMTLEAHNHQHRHEAMSHNHSHRHDDGHHNHGHEGMPPSTRHSHEHDHEATEHGHSHTPDLHHRHDH